MNTYCLLTKQGPSFQRTEVNVTGDVGRLLATQSFYYVPDGQEVKLVGLSRPAYEEKLALAGAEVRKTDEALYNKAAKFLMRSFDHYSGSESCGGVNYSHNNLIEWLDENNIPYTITVD